jgi:hypothetical protein
LPEVIFPEARENQKRSFQILRITGRQEAFWEERYYATAIEFCCLVYIDLNMVRKEK